MSHRINKRYGVAVFLMLFMCVAVFCSCSKKNNQRRSVKPVPTMVEATQNFTGVITNVDRELSQLTLRELDEEVDTILNYNSTSVIMDRYKKEITGDELQQGQIVNVTYTVDDADVTEINVPKDVWEYQEVEEFSFDNDNNALSLAGRKYQYTSGTYFSTPESKIQMMELNSQDILTVRGIGITVYSVTRTSGHGYVRLSGYSDFIGGMVNIGNSVILPITENMLITMGEGNYRITLSKNRVHATKTVNVKDGEEEIVDFSDFVSSAAENVGNVTFNIEPYGADLYINGTMVDYSSPLALNYGTYKVVVEMTGYNSYSGTLDVKSTNPVINIDLIEEETSVASKSTATPSATGGSKNKPATKTIDSSHTITVNAPEGAEVYLDNVYKGLAPCTFTKVIGSQTITLSRTGYITKSYSIDILDDKKDVNLSFGPLAESLEDTEATASPKPALG